jgi:hypothetical protein
MDAARKQILDLGQSTATQRQRAALTLGHAEQALSVAENTLVRNQGDLATAYVINRMAVQGGALIQSADQLAELARAASDGASSALSVAATSIRTLAGAFDTLAASVAGVHAIASNDDFGSAMAHSAKKSEHAVDRADHTVEQLKAASLSASIQSARSMAASAATSVNAVGTEIQGLVDRASALLGAAQARVNDSAKARAAAAQAERAAQMTYHQTKIDSEALDDGTTGMDAVLNGSLTVAVSPAPRTGPGGPALEATYKIPFQRGDVFYFFALLEDEAPGFSYHDARTAVLEASQSDSPAHSEKVVIDDKVKLGGPVTATIRTTAAGKPITAGQAYRVFAYHVPRGGAYATNASALSYPSRTVEVRNPIPDLDRYQVQRGIPDPSTSPPTLLQVQIYPPAGASEQIREYRAFVLLEDVYRAVKDDAAFLTGLFSPSSYKALPSKPPPPKGTQATDRAAPPTGDPTCVFTWQLSETDAYGDLIVEGVSYEVLVMLVPKAADTMASALLLAQPPSVSGAAPPTPPTPARATPAGGKPAPEGAAPNPGQTPPGTGAK